MNSIKISIIVPVYNAENSLKHCIESILSQSYKNIEVILVNDGSTDNSLRICEDFSDADERVFIINQANAGVSTARNRGLKAATGEYIQFVDADDFIKSNMCERLLNVMLAYESDVVICGYNRIEKGKTLKKIPKENITKSLSDFKEKFLEIFDKALFNAPWNKLYKKEKISHYFNKKIDIGEDLLFNLSYFSNCSKIVSISDCLYNYNVACINSLSSKYIDELFDVELMLYNEVKAFCMSNFTEFDDKFINKVFAKEIYYYLKKLVILSSEDKKSKLKKIQECSKNECVINMLNNLDTNDTQIKILCFLLKKRLINIIYAFFKLKELLN